MRILIIANAPPVTEARWKDESLSDRAVEGLVKAVTKTLNEQRQGHDIKTLFIGENPETLIEGVRSFGPEMVFNFCETLLGNSRLEPAPAYLLDWLGVPFSGNPSRILAILADKILTKRLLQSLHLPTPDFLALSSEKDLESWGSACPFPAIPTMGCMPPKSHGWRISLGAILKPAHEDASLGIDTGSVVHTMAAAATRYRLLAEKFGNPVIMEQYVAGREINAAVLQTRDGLKIGLNEIDFSRVPPDRPAILTYNAKWLEDSEECQSTPVIPGVKLPATLDRSIRFLASEAFHKLELQGYARVDFRIDGQGNPFILEINPNPDLSPDAGFSKAMPEMGVSYAQAIQEIIQTTLARKGGEIDGRNRKKR